MKETLKIRATGNQAVFFINSAEDPVSYGEVSCGLHAKRLARNVSHWYADSHVAERECGLVHDPIPESPCPLTGIAVRYRQRNHQWKVGVLVCSLSAQQILQVLGWPLDALEDEQRALSAYLTSYDQRGGGIESSFRGDKEGLGLLRRCKKCFEAQEMLVLLNSLVHNVIIWTRDWLIGEPSSPASHLHHYAVLRMVRDVFHISGLLLLSPAKQVVHIRLNQ